MGNEVVVSREARVWTVMIDRPERRNAVDRVTADALVAAFEGFDNDPEARVAVLCGSGGTFCAGADLAAVASGDAAHMNRAAWPGPGPMGPTRMHLTKPVIAAIDGHAVAGGMELAYALAELPQRCLRSDRASVYAALDAPTMTALEHELAIGLATLTSGESLAGARRFVAGAGRHGTRESGGD